MNVTQVSSGRFHHFHLARQMERRGLLKEIWTGYPRFKLADEHGIPPSKIRSFPWLQTLYMGWSKIPFLGHLESLQHELGYWAHETLDRRVSMAIDEPTILVALSGQGQHSGRKAQELGGSYICDRGSSHIRLQEEILREEYRIWGVNYQGIDARVIAKEEAEYEGADLITVPSDFCRQSFVAKGVSPKKLRVVPYGGRLDRFFPMGSPEPEAFNALFVGQVSLRKGIPYLLQAFSAFKHPNKKLTIIGSVQSDIRAVLGRMPLDNVEFLGNIPNAQLAAYYSRSDVLILPSVEEGLAMVMAEALACGCPVIATENTGARNLFDPHECGAIVEIRSVSSIVNSMNSIYHDGSIRAKSAATISRLNGWDNYGEKYSAILHELTRRP